MSTNIAESVVGQTLKTFIKSAGEEAVKHICSWLGSILNRAHESSVQANEKVDEVISSLKQLQKSRQGIERAVPHVDLNIVTIGIQKDISTINSISGY